MSKERKPIKEGYQPLKKGYKPKPTNTQTRPPKGGTGESGSQGKKKSS